MTLTDLSAASLDQLEAQLVADLDVVRRFKALVGRYQPLTVPATALSAILSADSPPAAAAPTSPVLPAAPPPAPYVPPPRHPNWNIADVNVAVRQIISTFSGTFGIGDVKKQLDTQHYRTFGDSTVRAALQTMQEKGEILLSRRGIGRGGNKYSRPAPAVSTEIPPV